MGKKWDRSGLVEFDNNGERADGALAWFFVGDTTTPLTVYQDADETTPHAHPLEASANGRWPLVFIPFCDSYDEKVATEEGTQLSYFTEIPNPNPVEAAADTVDDSEIFSTGMVAFDPVGGTKSGWVRLNGRTIGSASSGATERANADTSDLYTRLYNNFADSILAVSGGRGSSAAADFAANKPIALFDCRGAGLRGVDDMGNSAASLFGFTPFTTGDATTAGSIAGLNSHVLTEAQNAAHTHGTGTYAVASDGAHTHTGTTDAGGAHTHTITDPGHTHAYSAQTPSSETAGSLVQFGSIGSGTSGFTIGSNTTGISINTSSTHTHTFTTASGGSHTHSLSGSSASSGSGTAHNNVAKDLLGTWYAKL